MTDTTPVGIDALAAALDELAALKANSDRTDADDARRMALLQQTHAALPALIALVGSQAARIRALTADRDNWKQFALERQADVERLNALIDWPDRPALTAAATSRSVPYDEFLRAAPDLTDPDFPPPSATALDGDGNLRATDTHGTTPATVRDARGITGWHEGDEPAEASVRRQRDGGQLDAGNGGYWADDIEEAD